MGVISTSALRSLFGTLQTLFLAPFSSVMTFLVFADIVDLSLIPKTDFNPSNGPNGRNGEFLLPNPAVKRVPANADKFRDFYSGMGRHLNNRIGLYGCQVKSETGAAQLAGSGSSESYTKSRLSGRAKRTWSTAFSHHYSKASTAMRRTMADVGSERTANRPASSRERVGHVLTCSVMGRFGIGVGSHSARR